MRAWHFRQRPPSSSQLTTGMLSYGLICVLQAVQCDDGSTTDSSRGIRRMQTFKKLPITSPSKNMAAAITAQTLPQAARRLNAVRCGVSDG